MYWLENRLRLYLDSLRLILRLRERRRISQASEPRACHNSSCDARFANTIQDSENTAEPAGRHESC